MEEMIQSIIEEIKSLILDQLELKPDNMVEENYKSRTISNYSAALKNLIEIKGRERNGATDRNNG